MTSNAIVVLLHKESLMRHSISKAFSRGVHVCYQYVACPVDRWPDRP